VAPPKKRRGKFEENVPPPPSHPPETLSVSGLRVDRGGRAILSGVGFALHSGEALVVLGRNGAGKSTLLRALAGLLPLRAGAISFGADSTLGEHAHYIGHADGLKGALTALDNLDFWARLLGGASAGRALTPQQALEKIGLARIGEFPVGYLSAGQKRRVALARLFVAPRPIWLLDEPATALDALSQQRLAQAMAEHRAGGGFIIAATHAPLGLADARELRLDASAAPAVAGAA
jgi:heme exporter protein A